MFGERIQLSSPLAFGNVHPFTFRASIPLSVVSMGCTNYSQITCQIF